MSGFVPIYNSVVWCQIINLGNPGSSYCSTMKLTDWPWARNLSFSFNIISLFAIRINWRKQRNHECCSDILGGRAGFKKTALNIQKNGGSESALKKVHKESLFQPCSRQGTEQEIIAIFPCPVRRLIPWLCHLLYLLQSLLLSSWLYKTQSVSHLFYVTVIEAPTYTAHHKYRTKLVQTIHPMRAACG